jgi:hypothetical protein
MSKYKLVYEYSNWDNEIVEDLYDVVSDKMSKMNHNRVTDVISLLVEIMVDQGFISSEKLLSILDIRQPDDGRVYIEERKA